MAEFPRAAEIAILDIAWEKVLYHKIEVLPHISYDIKYT